MKKHWLGLVITVFLMMGSGGLVACGEFMGGNTAGESLSSETLFSSETVASSELLTSSETSETSSEDSAEIHTHQFSIKWEYDVNNHWRVCVCGDTSEIGVHIWDEGEVTKEPTCAEQGMKIHLCDCDATIITAIESNSDHTEVIDEAVAATCTGTGLTEGKHCSVCSTVLIAQEEVAATGHTEVIDEAVAAMCTGTGLTEGKHCSVCNTVLIAQEEVAATGHTEENIPAVEAKCAQIGLTEGKKCGVCGEIMVAQTEIPAKGHRYQETVVLPTQTQDGYTLHTCENCGQFYMDNYVAATGSVGLSYIWDKENKTYGVAGMGSCSDSNVYIPSYVGEYPVVAIANGAFKNRSDLNSVTIPNSVKSIGSSAFWGCAYLTSVKFGNGVTKIGASAFYGCYGLESVELPESVTTIEESAFLVCGNLSDIKTGNAIKTIGANAFLNTSYYNNSQNWDNGVLYLNKYVIRANSELSGAHTLKEGTLAIADGAFQKCGNLTSVQLPDTVITVGSLAFYNCGNLASVYISESVTAIGADALGYCKSLTSITVNESNAIYQSIDGNLYTKDGKELVQYAIGKSSAWFCVPSGVATVAASAFWGYANLVNIAIDGSVTAIGDYAFRGCNNLANVYYKGAAEDWEQIAIGSSENSCLTNATRYYYSETQPAEKGNYWHYVNGEICVWTFDLAYTVNEDGKTCTVTGRDACEDAAVVIPQVINGYTVTAIGQSAFFGDVNLTEIAIPNSVLLFDNGAFCENVNLKTIYYKGDIAGWCNISFDVVGLFDYAEKLYIGDTLISELVIPNTVSAVKPSAFSCYKGLTSVVIENGVTAIGESAFSWCENLERVSIGADVVSIGNGSFISCSKLKDITVDNDNKAYIAVDGNLYTKDKTILIQYAIGKTAQSFTVPEGVTTIGNSAFRNCTNLTDVTMYDSITTIENNAFFGCKNLRYITISENVTSIGHSTFMGCSQLMSVVIPNKATSIDGMAFCGCKNLTSIVIPDSVKKIRNMAFSASGLTDISIGAGVEFIANDAFSSCVNLKNISVAEENTTYASIDGNLYTKDKTKLVRYAIGKTAQSFTVPYGVQFIGEAAFKNSENLTSVIISEQVIGIRNSAFSGCKNLISISIPDSVVSIGRSAFENCKELTSIVISDAVTTIESYAFQGCNKLETVMIPVCLTQVRNRAFLNCNSLTKIYYGGTVDEWTEMGIEEGNEHLQTATVYYYSETQPAEKGNYWHYVNGEICVWTFDLAYTPIDNGEAYAVTGLGNCLDADVVIPSTYNGLPVREISAKAFRNAAIKSIIIPDSVTTIKNEAFMGSTIEKVDMSDSVLTLGWNVFNSCSSLKEVVLSNGLTDIGRGTFVACYSLESIEVPQKVTTIFDSTFYNCRKLVSVKLPQGLKRIEGYAFSGCSQLSEINFPDSIVAIDKVSFQTCIALAKTRENGVSYIGDENNPYYCLLETSDDTLTSYTIHPQTKVVAGLAFSGCKNLISITVPDGVVGIGSGAFWNCSALTNVSIPNSVSDIGGQVFCLCTALKTVNLPEGITRIEDSMFSGCSSLVDLKIPDTVRTIGSEAFGGCSSLNIKIPYGITHIEYGAFSGCISMVIDRLPDSVVWFDPNAFGCQVNYTKYNDVSYIGTESNPYFALMFGQNGEIHPQTKLLYCLYEFANNMGTEVVIPEGVTTIASGVFVRCMAQSVVVPTSVTWIDGSTNCVFGENITQIIYKGTMAQWNAIKKAGTWLQNASVTKIICTDGKVAVEGL